jgi:hypothetical protein
MPILHSSRHNSVRSTLSIGIPAIFALRAHGATFLRDHLMGSATASWIPDQVGDDLPVTFLRDYPTGFASASWIPDPRTDSGARINPAPTGGWRFQHGAYGHQPDGGGRSLRPLTSSRRAVGRSAAA